MNEIRQAAERLKRWANDPTFYKDYRPDFGSCGMEQTRDLTILANAWIAEHPADDEMPIDEAWLRSVGFKDDDTDLTIYGHGDIRGHMMIVYCRRRYVFSIGNVRGNHITLADWWPTPTTRGQLRRLAAALGIELKA